MFEWMVKSVDTLLFFYCNGHLFVLPGNVLLVNQAKAADYRSYAGTASSLHGTSQETSHAVYFPNIFHISHCLNFIYIYILLNFPARKLCRKTSRDFSQEFQSARCCIFFFCN